MHAACVGLLFLSVPYGTASKSRWPQWYVASNVDKASEEA
jgi:hypothetical protein